MNSHLDKTLTVYIAEDETAIRTGLQQYIPWDEWNCTVIGTGSDGQEALHYVRLHAVDILITDIRMPKLDGLALLDALSSANVQTRVILISAHSEFSYVHTALQYEMVDDYLLKPLQPAQLESAIRRCSSRIYGTFHFPILRPLNKQDQAEYLKPCYRSAIHKAIEDLQKFGSTTAIQTLQTIYDTIQYSNGSLNLAKHFSFDFKKTLDDWFVQQDKMLNVAQPTRDIAYEWITAADFSHLTASMHWYLEYCADLLPRSTPAAIPLLIQSALQMIEQNYGKSDFCLQSLADSLGVSSPHLSVKFQQTMGIGFTKYLNRLRLERAQQLLVESSLPITEISQLSGYQDTNYFSRQFRSHTGQTPKEFRTAYLTQKIVRCPKIFL